MRTQSEWKVEISGRGKKGTGPLCRNGPEGSLAHKVGLSPFLRQQGRSTLLHLVGGLVGEGDGQDPLRPRTVADQLGDAVGDHPGLAGSRPASTSSGPASVWTASYWAGFRSIRGW